MTDEARSASSVIDEAAAMLGTEPDAPLKAKFQQDGIRWAWQLRHIEASQWDGMGVLLGLQTAIKDVLAREECTAKAEKPCREEVPSTPTTADALFRLSALATESPETQCRPAAHHRIPSQHSPRFTVSSLQSSFRMRQMMLEEVAPGQQSTRLC